MVEKVNACLVQAGLLLMRSKGLFPHVFPICSCLYNLLVGGFWLGRSPVAISCSCADHHSCTHFLPKAHHVWLCLKSYSKLCCSLIRSLNHCISAFLRRKCHRFVCKGDCLRPAWIIESTFVWLPEHKLGQAWKTFSVA